MTGPHAPCVLVVDDSAFTRRALIADLPSELAPHVVEACDGLEALEAFERSAPQFVFLDVAMPRMDGLAVLEALQGRPHQAWIVVVTSERAPEIERRAISLGARCVLRKPWKREEVVQVLRQAGY